MTSQATAVLHVEEKAETWTSVHVDGLEYRRHPVRTRWLTEADGLVTPLKDHLDMLRPGDTVAVSEKVVILLTGRAVDITTVQPGPVARALAGKVRPRTGSRGLSVPEKMEYVVRTVGFPRVIAAAVCGAMTRPIGMHGTFYRVAGSVARDIDGGRPPYESLLFPPLEPAVAHEISADLERALGVGVGIVDLNDFGGSIRAVSPRSLPARTLAAVLADNPMGQRSTSTPMMVIRPA